MLNNNNANNKHMYSNYLAQKLIDQLDESQFMRLIDNFETNSNTNSTNESSNLLSLL